MIINGIKTNLPLLYYYQSSINKTQSSGAYIFRPADDQPTALPLLPQSGIKTIIKEGDVSYDIISTYGKIGETKFRIMKETPYILHEFILGPLPRQGIEVIIRFNTGIKSFDQFYTGTTQ